MSPMFDALPDTALTPLQQSAEYAAALTLFGSPPLHVPGGPLVLVRRFGPVTLGMIPRGGADALERLRAQPGWARRPVILSPDAPGHAAGLPLISPAHVATLDLTIGASALRAGLKGKWRNRLVRAEALGLRIGRRALPDRTDQWLFRAEAAMQAARRYRTWPAALTLCYARVNPGKAVLFTATDKGHTVAAMLFLRHGHGATYHIGQTSAEGRARHAHTALMWAAIKWHAAHGVRQLELGTIDTESAPGLARFKRGTGARVRPLGGTWLDAPLLRPLAPFGRLDTRLMQG
ncbi:MAG: GNAT family N-acetyltransferase [Pseudomonadota bacterium]